LALRMINVTGRRRSWLFISGAVVLIAFQRSLTFSALAFGTGALEPDRLSEVITFYFSILMALGIAGLRPLFLSLRSAREATLASEARYRTLLENIPQRIILKDMQGRYASCNGHFAREFGMQPEEVRNRTDADFFPPDLARRFAEVDRKTLQANRMREDEEKYVDANGHETYLHVIRTPSHNSRGEINGLLVMYMDITERKLIELGNRQIQKMMRDTQRLESLGVLTGGIAHDFNNLLTGVLGNVHLALHALQEEAPLKENLLNIQTAAERAATLTSQMLAYSGQGQYAMSCVLLQREMRGIIDYLTSSCGKKAKIEFTADEKTPAIQADPAHLNQVVVNLATNAWESVPHAQGLVRIRIFPREVSPDDTLFPVGSKERVNPGSYAAIEVADNGCGFDPAETRRLFEPFHSTKFVGRGLGLPAALGIVRAHRGALLVDSVPGKGSTFTVLFPAANNRPKGAPDKPS